MGSHLLENTQKEKDLKAEVWYLLWILSPEYFTFSRFPSGNKYSLTFPEWGKFWMARFEAKQEVTEQMTKSIILVSTMCCSVCDHCLTQVSVHSSLSHVYFQVNWMALWAPLLYCVKVGFSTFIYSVPRVISIPRVLADRTGVLEAR